MNVFTGLGYNLSNVAKGGTNGYRLPNSGYILNSPTMDHPWGTWVLSGKTVYYVDSSGLVPVPSWEIFLNNGGKPEHIAKATGADLTILKSNPGLPLLMNNDGRVIR